MRKLRTIAAHALIVAAFSLGLVQTDAWAGTSLQIEAILQRDTSYEEKLRWTSSADQAITPRRVLRWMMGFRGPAIEAQESPTDFRPIVHANNADVQVIAALTYKF